MTMINKCNIDNLYKNFSYTVVPFFNLSVYICGNEKYVTAVMFDSYLNDSKRSAIEKNCRKENTFALDVAVTFFERYQKKQFNTPIPPCDLSIYTIKEQLVLNTLLAIAPGKTISYGQLAAQCGLKNAARFAGNVMAKNVFPVIYPCHRVIRSNGDVGNYSGGEGIKELLLRFESNGVV